MQGGDASTRLGFAPVKEEKKKKKTEPAGVATAVDGVRAAAGPTGSSVKHVCVHVFTACWVSWECSCGGRGLQGGDASTRLGYAPVKEKKKKKKKKTEPAGVATAVDGVRAAAGPT